MGFICEIYLKGLLLPHLNVSIPEELKSKIGNLSEEEEYMILVADDEKIRKWNNKKNLTKRELRIIGECSIKSLGHNLLSLIGSKFNSTDEEKKPVIYLDKNVRESIILGIKEYFTSKDDIDSLEKYLIALQKMNESLDGMPYGKTRYDELVEEKIEDPTVGDAFVRSRFATFDNYVADTDFLVKFAMAIRKSINYEYITVIDIKEKNESKEPQIGRLIFPDSGSQIYIDDDGDGKNDRIYRLKPTLRDNPAEPTMGVREIPSIERGEDIYSISLEQTIKDLKNNQVIFGDKTLTILERLQKIGNGNIIYYNNGSNVKIKYIRKGKEIQLALKDGKLVEESIEDFERI